MSTPSASTTTPETCITCGDVAQPLRVAEIVDEHTARCVAADGGVEEVATDLVGAVSLGATLLVHARVAIAEVTG